MNDHDEQARPDHSAGTDADDVFRRELTVVALADRWEEYGPEELQRLVDLALEAGALGELLCTPALLERADLCELMGLMEGMDDEEAQAWAELLDADMSRQSVALRPNDRADVVIRRMWLDACLRRDRPEVRRALAAAVRRQGLPLPGVHWRALGEVACGVVTVQMPGVGARVAPGGWGDVDVVGVCDPDCRKSSGRYEHTGEVRALAAVELPGGRAALATGGPDPGIRIWDLTARRCDRVLDGHKAGTYHLAAVPQRDGSRGLLAHTDDGRLHRWDLATGEHTVQAERTADEGRIFQPCSAVVTSAAGRTWFAVERLDLDRRATDSVWLHALDTPEVTPVELLREPGGCVGLLHAVPGPDGGELLAVGMADGDIRLWDLDRRRETGRLRGHAPVDGSLLEAQFDGDLLYAPSVYDGDGWVKRVWHPGAVVPLPGGRTGLAVADTDGVLLVWDIRQPRPLARIDLPGDPFGLAALPDGRVAAVIGDSDRGRYLVVVDLPLNGPGPHTGTEED